MASDDARTTEMPESGDTEAGEPAPVPDAPSRDGDPLARFGERLRPDRRFYANPAGC